jgi:amino acid adenylation domain-containing protein
MSKFQKDNGPFLNIVQAFEDTVARFPERVAVKNAAGVWLTYAELNARANRVARRLRRLGAGPQTRVGLLLEKDLELMVSIVAILKTGAAYLPLDPSYPAERIVDMMDDGAPVLVLTEERYRERFAQSSQRLVVGDSAEWKNTLSSEDTTNLGVEISSDSVAYVIYTSGSSGRSKGTLTPHGAVLRLFAQAETIYGFDEKDVWTLFHSYCFDFSVWEIWGALFFGGTLVVVPHAVARSSADFHELLGRENVTVLNSTPSAFTPLMRRQLRAASGETSLRYVILGGESLDFSQLSAWFERYGFEKPRVVNGYGPTETTIFATFKVIGADDLKNPISNIGKGLADLTLEVVDSELRPVAEGQSGELLISGPGVAAGYLNRPELTLEKFVTRAGTRAYRSGDRVKKLASGEFEYQGRLDDQIKLRGYRIELGDIENALARQSGVQQAGACLKGKGAQARILAFVVADQGVDIRVLKARLHETLPDFMVPSEINVVAELPLNAHGKLDRQALAELEVASVKDGGASVGALEARLRALWAELLGKDSLDRDANFFESGGSSLLGEVLLERMEEKLGLRATMLQLMDNPTVASLAKSFAVDESEEDLSSSSRSTGKASSSAIAVISMRARYPGARNVDELWKILREGCETLRFFESDELDASEEKDRPNYVAARGLVDGAADFDAEFFGFNQNEAIVLDPQQRLFLELCWEALEQAGYVGSRRASRIGVFGGVSANTYYLKNVLCRPDLLEKVTPFGAQLLNEKDYVASRVSYKLDLKGPALSIHTACSTSLVAIAEAFFALREGRCDMALAGGVSILSPQESGHLYQEGGMLSKDGHTLSFDDRGSGTVFSDGAGVVLLKRLEDAERDGDEILAVVRGAAVNNDGALKPSFTAPSIEGQVEVIREALRSSGLKARDISYVEAHGTATPLGDPMELEALARAYRVDTDDKAFCTLGSVKSNFGHTVAAAGVGGFIKTVLALKNSEIPASLGCKKPTSKHDWSASPFVVNTSLKPWRGPRRAGVSSFGVGGTNAHVVLEQAPQAAPRAMASDGETPRLVTISARNEPSLSESGRLWAESLSNEASLADLSYTSIRGRRSFSDRRWFVVSSVKEAREALVKGSAEFSGQGKVAGPRDVSFLFPGNGAGYAKMPEELLAKDESFARHFDECLDASGSKRTPQIDLFATEYALARALLERGVRPSYLVGYSLGEIAAATVAGVFSLDDVFKVLWAQEKTLREKCRPGTLLSVRLSAEELAPYLEGSLEIAGDNSPLLSVVAGSEDDIRLLEAKLSKAEIPRSRLGARHAFHSKDMDPAVEELEKVLSTIRLSAPRMKLVSAALGREITAAEALDPKHWARIVRDPVFFRGTMEKLVAANRDHVWLEVGPSAQLATFTRQSKEAPEHVVAALPLTSANEAKHWLSAQAKLWALGVNISLPVDEKSRILALPTYPFQRRRYWADVTATATAISAPAASASSATSSESALEDSIALMFEDISGLEVKANGPDMSFLEMGMDSLFLTSAVTALEKKFKVSIGFRRLTEDLCTIRLLADFLRQSGSTGTATAASASGSLAGAKSREKSAEELEVTKVPFGAIARVARSSEDFTEQQAEAFERWRNAYVSFSKKSKEHAEVNRRHFADPRVVSGFKPKTKEIVYPIAMERTKGSRMWDIDGNEYIDLLNGFGTNFLGHSMDFVKEAQKRQLDLGIEVGPSTPLAAETAKLFCEVTGNDRAAFCCTGSEAVMGCIRVARTSTGRDLLVVFAGSYHGIFDEVIVRGGKNGKAYAAAPGIMPSSVGNTLVLEYGNPKSLEMIRERAHEIAAVLVEPVQSRNPRLQPRDFLHELRDLTTETGICLIFDEVITGLRAHPGGAQAIFGVKADIASYGKVVGGSNPIGVIAGKAKFMDALDGGHWRFGDDSRPEVGVTYFAGTYLRHPLALAAAKAVLEHLKKEGPELQERLTAKTAKFVAEVNEDLRALGAPFELHTFASLLRVTYKEDLQYSELFCLLMRMKGVHILDGFPCFLSDAHTQEDLAHCRRAFRECVIEMQEAGFFPAPENATVSPAQREIWVASQLGDEASLAFNESVTLQLKGRPDEAALEKTLRWLVNRHEALRTSFSAKTGAMKVAASHEGPILSRVNRDEVAVAFDLSHGPLVRFQLLDKGADVVDLVITAHHIVCDGWSFAVILREISAGYEAFLAGRTPSLPPAPAMADYNRSRLKLREKNKAFWLSQFKTLPDRMELPADLERPARRGFASRRLDYELDAELVKAVRSAGIKAGCSFFTTLFTGLSTWLARVTGQNDLVIGVAKAGQASCNFPELVGHCVNTLPVRTQVDPLASFADNLKGNRSLLLECFEHGDYTFGELLGELKLPRTGDRVPLMPLLFNLDQAMDVTKLPWGGLQASFVSNPRVSENFELFINAVELGDGRMSLETQYSTDLFSASQVRELMDSFAAYLKDCAAPDKKPVAKLALASSSQLKRLSSVDGSARVRETCAATLFDVLDNAFEASDLSGRKLTLGDTKALAAALAGSLEAAGLKAGERVVLLAERNARLPAILLGMLSASLVYVPLDPSYPIVRSRDIVEDADPAAILCSKIYANVVSQLGRKVLWIEDLLEKVDSAAAATLKSPRPEAPAYILYTSGSTGKSKGVVVSHGALTNFLLSMKNRPGLSSTDRIAAITNLTFDIAGLELYLPLVAGAKLLVIDRETARDPTALLKVLEKQEIGVLQATPTTWSLLALAGLATSRLRLKALCGGEALPKDLAAQLVNCCRELWNMYGPTETTIWSSCHRVTAETLKDNFIPIGAPIEKTQIHILDDDLQPLPPGLAGEICIGGAGVADGYWRNEKLTLDRFVASPFAGASSSGRLYRTGDLGRRDSRGEIQILGRKDLQVKIRGHRIEIGEIEAALSTHPEIRLCAVVAAPSNASFELVAAYVSSKELRPSELRSHLVQSLPESSVPTRFIRLDAIPMTAADKIDRVGLTQRALSQCGEENETGASRPLTTPETRMAEAWGLVLKQDPKRLSPRSDFFLVGGHSVLAMRLIGQLEKMGLKLTLRDIFETPTLEDLTRKCTAVAVPLEEIKKAGNEKVPLSLMQARLYYMTRLHPQSRAFNLPASWVLKGKLDRKAMQAAMDRLLERQKSLSFVFKEYEDGVWLEEKAFRLDLGFEKLSGPKLQARLEEEAARAFDPLRGPLFFARIFETGGDEHVLCVVAHHLVFDGWSFDLLLEELNEGYAAALASRPARGREIPLDYRDFAQWHNDSVAAVVERHAPYWQNKLRDFSPLLLPTDRPRRDDIPYRGRMMEFSVDALMAQRLNDIARTNGATLYMLMLAAFKTLLHRWSAQEDVVVGVPVQGRQRPELQSVIGFFVNTVLVRSRPRADAAFASYLSEVKEACIEAFDHQDMPIEKLSDVIRKGSGARGPLFQAFFSYQDTRNRGWTMGNLELGQKHLHTGWIAYEVSLAIKETGRGLHGEIDYCQDLFDEATVKRFMDDYKGLLADIAERIDFPLGIRSGNPISNAAPTKTAGVEIAFEDEALPRTENEKAIAALWQELTKASFPIRRTDNFFDIGGHSLLVIPLIKRIDKNLGIEFSPQDLVTNNLMRLAQLGEQRKAARDHKGFWSKLWRRG